MKCPRCGARMIGEGAVKACVSCRRFRTKRRPLLPNTVREPIVLRDPPAPDSSTFCPACGLKRQHWPGCPRPIRPKKVEA